MQFRLEVLSRQTTSTPGWRSNSPAAAGVTSAQMIWPISIATKTADCSGRCAHPAAKMISALMPEMSCRLKITSVGENWTKLGVAWDGGCGGNKRTCGPIQPRIPTVRDFHAIQMKKIHGTRGIAPPQRFGLAQGVFRHAGPDHVSFLQDHYPFRGTPDFDLECVTNKVGMSHWATTRSR